MTDLRCARTVHVKALGTLIERRCPECSRAMSVTGRRVSVYHRWEYQRSGRWLELNDRIVEPDVPDDVRDDVRDDLTA